MRAAPDLPVEPVAPGDPAWSFDDVTGGAVVDALACAVPAWSPPAVCGVGSTCVVDVSVRRAAGAVGPPTAGSVVFVATVLGDAAVLGVSAVVGVSVGVNAAGARAALTVVAVGAFVGVGAAVAIAPTTGVTVSAVVGVDDAAAVPVGTVVTVGAFGGTAVTTGAAVVTTGMLRTGLSDGAGLNFGMDGIVVGALAGVVVVVVGAITDVGS